MVNIWYFADPGSLTGDVSAGDDSPTDLAVRFAVAALFEAKFYLLFSFLFGYSFVLQQRAAIEQEASHRARMLRRLGTLFVLGLLHGTLLFFGDILLTYSLMGLILLATHTVRPATAAVTGAVLTGVIGSLVLAIGLFVAVATTGAPPPTLFQPGALTDSPAAVFSSNAETFGKTVATVVLFQGPLALAMFYLGLAAARIFLLERRIPTSALTRTTVTCLPAGLAAGVFQAYLTIYLDRDQYGVLATGISILTAPLQTAGYVSLLLLLFRTPAGMRVCRLLAPAGRIALTNYLLQSVAMALVFTAYGLRLSNQLPAVAVGGIAVVIFLAQLLLSRLLLQRFRTGPAEWLLRRVTYWKAEKVRYSSAG